MKSALNIHLLISPNEDDYLIKPACGRQGFHLTLEKQTINR